MIDTPIEAMSCPKIAAPMIVAELMLGSATMQAEDGEDGQRATVQHPMGLW